MIRPGFTVWLTGLPVSGKTTLGRMLTRALRALGMGAVHLEGSDIRRALGPELDFSPEDRRQANQRAAWVASRIAQAGGAAVVSAIAPSAAARREARAMLGEYVEVFLDCPLEQLINRDERQLYARALESGAGEFTGLGAPYEPPADPEVRCLTGRETPEESLAKVLAYLSEAGLIAQPDEGTSPAGGSDGEAVYSDEEEAEIVARLKDLGYL